MGEQPHVVIIGAGFGGLCMAAEVLRSGVATVSVFEEGPDVGGIWRDNTYPGCGCDVPSHLYSFSFAKYRSATTRFPRQTEILDYLRDVTQRFDLRRHIHFHSPVTAAAYDDATGKWTVTVGNGDTHEADVVVSAVGQLHRPKLPDITSKETFAGPAFHTAQWDDSVDVTGRDVAVIGNGSSAAQLIGPLAELARSVTVYQRTPNWVLPKPAAGFGPITKALLTVVPGAHAAYRAAVYVAADLALAPVISRGWSTPLLRYVASRHLSRSVTSPELQQRLTPDYPIGCKRILVDSDFYPALNRENVELVTDGIHSIVPSGVVTDDGRERSADIVVFATGFRTTEFLVPMTVTGRGGADLQQRWLDGAEAYLGIAIPEFPNFFLIHGPNTILGHNSNIFMIECQVHYVINCLRLLKQSPHSVLEVSVGAMTKYQQWLSKRIGRTVWHACNSWYKTDGGRVTNPWPAPTMRYYWMTRANPTRALELHPVRATAG